MMSMLQGHQIVAVFTIPDDNGKEDPVATDASRDGVKVCVIAYV